MLTLKIKWQRLVDEENKTCPRCRETEEELDKAYSKLRDALFPLGIDVILKKRQMSPGEFKNNPLTSNQIWIADRTLEEWLGAETGKSKCCDVCGDEKCRTVEAGNHTYETIPASLIIKAGLIAASEILPVEKPLSFKIQNLKFIGK